MTAFDLFIFYFVGCLVAVPVALVIGILFRK